MNNPAIHLSYELIERAKRASGKRTAQAAIRYALEKVVEEGARGEPSASTRRALGQSPSKRDKVFRSREEFAEWLSSIPRRASRS